MARNLSHACGKSVVDVLILSAFLKQELFRAQLGGAKKVKRSGIVNKVLDFYGG